MTHSELLDRLALIDNDLLQNHPLLAQDKLENLIADLKKPVVYEVTITDIGEGDFVVSLGNDVYEFANSRDNAIEEALFEINRAHSICGLDPITVENLKIVEKC